MYQCVVNLHSLSNGHKITKYIMGKQPRRDPLKKQQKAIKLESNASSQLKRPYTKYHHNSRVQTAETLIMQGLKQVPTCYSIMMHEEKTLVHN